MTSTKIPSLVLILFATVVVACDKSGEKPASTQTSSAQSAATTTSTTAKGEVKPTTTTPTPAPTPATEIKKEAGKPVVTWKGFSTPESVLHDDAVDEYLVSNVEGNPIDPDGKAFISRLAPTPTSSGSTEGKVLNLKWIESGKNKVTLNAPKGMALMGDNLYVADIDTVRIFDRKTGAPAGEVKIPGATFLNDMAAATDGSRVFVSDTGVKGKSMEASGTDAVYAIDKDKKLTTIAKSKDLQGPNGLAPIGDKIWVASFRSNELFAIDSKNGKKGETHKLPKGQLDGVFLYNDEILVSSWEANAVYRGKSAGTDDELKVFAENAPSPADISLDKKRSRLLVPLFNENEVRAYELASVTGAATK